MKQLLILILSLFFISSPAAAQEFQERPIEDFKMLDQFASVEAFEEYIGAYRQKCLDNSYGGSLSVRCFVGYYIWDRELNKYYRLLQEMLSDDQKAMLKEAQHSWIQTRDKTIVLNSSLLDDRYTQPGTMYIAIRAGDAASTISPIIKQRALLLRDWYLELSDK